MLIGAQLPDLHSRAEDDTSPAGLAHHVHIEGQNHCVGSEAACVSLLLLFRDCRTQTQGTVSAAHCR